MVLRYIQKVLQYTLIRPPQEVSMFRTISVLLIFAAALMNSCTSNPVEQSTNSAAPFTTVKSLLVRETTPARQEFVNSQSMSNNDFALAMYRQLVEEGRNCFFSPYSITTALAMTAAGAANATLEQMRSALSVTLPGIEFDRALNSIDQSLATYAKNTDGITFEAVNSSWMQSSWNFSIGYLNQLSQYYGAGMNLLDFGTEPENCRTIINDWVAEKTDEKITDLLPAGSIQPNTALVLTNAVYFLGEWQKSFNAAYTKNSLFHNIDMSTAEVPMMNFVEPGESVEMLYTRQPGVRAMDFPYKGERFVMTVLLPDFDSLVSFEKSLTVKKLDTLFSSLKKRKLTVSLPKFKFTYGSKSLKPALQALGMRDAFDVARADFSTMGGEQPLMISDVFHKAFIAVDEMGTEAAAATGVIMTSPSINDDMVIFVVNRPFIFVIRDKVTGTILFMGRILNPLTAS